MLKTSYKFAFLVFLSLLAGCAGRPGPEALRETAGSTAGTKTVTVYVATSRQRNEGKDGAFTAGRASQTSYVRYRISVPPGHEPGNIEWPGRTPDPNLHFVTVEQRLLDRSAFEEEVSRKRAGNPPSIGVFTHGYNTNFSEAVFRLAQMTADANVDVSPILFAWPSEGSMAGYVSDKDAVTYSRDQLVGLLTMLSGKSTNGNVTVMGHSMGGWLTTEALRQLRLTGKDDVTRRLNVILAAPDIDVDVFNTQMAVIGPLSPPMIVLVSRDDVALRVSKLLSVDRQRVGKLDVTDPRVEEVTRKAKIQVVDISQMEASDGFKHNRFVALAVLYPKLSGPGNASRPDLRQTGAFVFNAFGATLSSPFVLAGKVVAGE